MSDERLDRLIDEVARQMTEGDPSSDFRARVIARLDRPPRRAWWTSWMAVPLGAMAVTMIALVVARPFKDRDRGAGPPPRHSTQAAKKENGLGETGKADTTHDGPRATRVAAAGRRQNPSSGAAAEVAALAPPPLDVPPLGVEAIGINALPTDSIAVPQLDAIAPIEIAPLPADDGRPSGANEGMIDDSRLPT